MLEQLLESSRTRPRQSWSGAFSLLVHGILLSLAALVTRVQPTDTAVHVMPVGTSWETLQPIESPARPSRSSQQMPARPTIGTPAPVPLVLGDPGAGIIAGNEASVPPSDLLIINRALDDGRPFGMDRTTLASVVTSASADEPPVLLEEGHQAVPPGLGGVEGRVLLEFVIDREGRVEPPSVRVVEHSDSLFDSAAREMVVRSRYRPGRLDGHPVRVRVRQAVQFR